jgi:hypothetical protein
MDTEDIRWYSLGGNELSLGLRDLRQVMTVEFEVEDVPSLSKVWAGFVDLIWIVVYRSNRMLWITSCIHFVVEE